MSILGALGDLVLALSADTAKFEGDLGRAHRIAEKFGKDVGRQMTALAAQIAALAGAGSIGALIKSQIDAADAAGKMAEKIGISVESFSALKFAAEISNVSVETLEKGLKKLANNMADTQAGTGEAKDAFKALGISVVDSQGKLKPLDKMLEELAEKFAVMKDGTGKAALASKFFGDRIGLELIPFLNEGRSGIEGLKKEAERLGVVFTSEAAKAADEFNDNLTRLSGSVKGLAIEVGGPLVEALNKAAKAMEDGRKAGDSFFDRLIDGFRALTTGDDTDKWNQDFIRATEDLLDAQNRVDVIMRQPKWMDPFGAALKAAKADVEKFRKEIERLQAIKPILIPEKPQASDKPQQTEEAPALPDQKKLEELRKAEELVSRLNAKLTPPPAIDTAWDELSKVWAKAAFQAQTLEDRIAAMREENNKLAADIDSMIAKALEDPGKQADKDDPGGVGKGAEHAQKFRDFRIAMMDEEAREQFEHQQRLSDIRTEFTDKELERIGGRQEIEQRMESEHQARMLDIRAKGMGNIIRMLEKFRQGDISNAAEYAQELTSGLATHSKKWFELNKAVATANAIIKGVEATQAAFAWGMSVGGWYGAIAAAAAAAAFSIAKVAAIQQQQFGGGTAASIAGSAAAPPVTPIQPTDNQQRVLQQTTVIEFNADDDTLISTRSARKLLEQIAETTREGGRVLVVR